MKRGFDIICSLILLVCLAPLFAILAVVNFAMLGAPIFFRQPRVGKDGQIFELIKFRSMRDATPGQEADVDRLTGYGRWLRSTSMDELPELWNVLKGEMSLVGPRPLLVDYLPLYSPFQARRHEVRPGLTGWAQVNGRNAQSWPERFVLDVWYVDNQSLWLDIKILCKTLYKVIKREGISAESEATMPYFRGEQD